VALTPALTAGGVVVDEKGAPVAEVEVGDGGSSPFSRGTLARTGPSGRFRVRGLEAGTPYELRFSKPGFAPATAELPPLEAGQPVPDLRVVLRQGRTGFGRVVNRAEEPVAGAEVLLRPPAGEEPSFDLEDERSGTVTGPDGRFEIRDLPPGPFELAVRGRGYAPLRVPGLAIPEGAGATDLGTVILAPGVAVEGRVVDAQGQPVAGAEVTLGESSDHMPAFLALNLESSPAAVSGADGFFRIEDRAAGETVDLLARRTGYAPAGVPGVRVPPELPVRIVLTPSLAVEGRVVDQDGEPVASAMVIAFPADLMSGSMTDAQQPGNALSDTEGRFRIEGMSPGAIEVHAMALGRQQAVLKNLEIRPGQDLTGVEVVLAAGAVIQGRAVSAAGEPVVGATIHLADVETFFDATSDGDGHYRLEGVPPGIRTVLADHESYGPVERQVEVRMGTNTLDLTFEQGSARITGRVLDQDGEPLAGARVYLDRDTGYVGNLPKGMSGPDGSFTLSGVEEGAYQLFAEKAGFARSREGTSVTVEGSSVGGTSVEGIEVRLTPGGAVTGRILGLEFTDLSRVQVRSGHEGRVGQVRPDGTYRIDHVEPGEVEVVASLSGGGRQVEGTVVLEPGEAEARLDLEFGKGFTLTGRVLINGEPAKGEQLLLVKETGLSSRWSETDHAGRFRFEGLEGGTYHLDLAYRSGGFPDEEIEISADRDLLIDLRTSSISGRVLDAATRHPLPHATVTVVPAEISKEGEEGTIATDAATDSRGVFVLRNVPEGRWTVEASLAGYAPARLEVRIAGGRPLEEVELALQPSPGDLPAAEP
jgi:protocatechuate 3,4-dioxygenase beta subunit